MPYNKLVTLLDQMVTPSTSTTTTVDGPVVDLEHHVPIGNATISVQFPAVPPSSYTQPQPVVHLLASLDGVSWYKLLSSGPSGNDPSVTSVGSGSNSAPRFLRTQAIQPPSSQGSYRAKVMMVVLNVPDGPTVTPEPVRYAGGSFSFDNGTFTLDQA